MNKIPPLFHYISRVVENIPISWKNKTNYAVLGELIQAPKKIKNILIKGEIEIGKVQLLLDLIFFTIF